jgi:hypothetical protein
LILILSTMRDLSAVATIGEDAGDLARSHTVVWLTPVSRPAASEHDRDDKPATSVMGAPCASMEAKNDRHEQVAVRPDHACPATTAPRALVVGHHRGPLPACLGDTARRRCRTMSGKK